MIGGVLLDSEKPYKSVEMVGTIPCRRASRNQLYRSKTIGNVNIAGTIGVRRFSGPGVVSSSSSIQDLGWSGTRERR